jgi:hypothetical protein
MWARSSGGKSNPSFRREWGKVFPDPAMTLAAVDRLVHHATIFDMKGTQTVFAGHSLSWCLKGRSVYGYLHQRDVASDDTSANRALDLGDVDRDHLEHPGLGQFAVRADGADGADLDQVGMLGLEDARKTGTEEKREASDLGALGDERLGQRLRH